MNILVPTDFSDCANDAFDTACDLASPLKAEIHLLHAVDIPETWKNLATLEKYQAEVREEIITNATDKLKALQSYAQSLQIICHIHCEVGDFVASLEGMTNQLNVDLIIMGSHGSSGKKEWLWGANTQKVVRKIQGNVLFIKERKNPITISNVVFASDLNVEDQEVFKHFLRFIKPFDIKNVHVLAINTPGFFTQPSIIMTEALKDFKKIAYQYNCETHFYQDSSVNSGIREFSEKNKVDLIALSNRQRHPIKRIFQGSNVEMLVNHTDIPVLSINY